MFISIFALSKNRAAASANDTIPSGVDFLGAAKQIFGVKKASSNIITNAPKKVQEIIFAINSPSAV